MALLFTCCFEEHLNHVYYFQCVPLLCAISTGAAGVAAVRDLYFFFLFFFFNGMGNTVNQKLQPSHRSTVKWLQFRTPV